MLIRTVPGKNKRHMKEVAGLVSGVESGVSKERWAQSTTTGIGGLCANTHSCRPWLISHMCVDAQHKASQTFLGPGLALLPTNITLAEAILIEVAINLISLASNLALLAIKIRFAAVSQHDGVQDR